MSRSSWSLSVALSVVTAASLAYAWQLHLELAESDAAREAMKIELASLRNHASSPAKRAAASARVSAPTSTSSSHAENGVEPNAGPGLGGPRGQNRGAQFAAFRDSPEVQALMAMERKAALDSRYAGLFKKLNLSPADLDRFKNLLADKQATAADVMAAARAQGLNPRDNRDEIRALVANFEAESDASIQASLGSAVYEQYKQYEQTIPQRGVVGQLEQRLSYSAAPLSGDQGEQLVSLLAAAAPPRDNNALPALFAPPGGGAGGFGGRGGAPIPDSVVAQSQGILSAPQVDALRQLQQEQAAAAALRQQMRAQANATATTTATPAKPSGP